MSECSGIITRALMQLKGFALWKEEKVTCNSWVEIRSCYISVSKDDTHTHTIAKTGYITDFLPSQSDGHIQTHTHIGIQTQINICTYKYNHAHSYIHIHSYTYVNIRNNKKAFTYGGVAEAQHDHHEAISEKHW